MYQLTATTAFQSDTTVELPTSNSLEYTYNRRTFDHIKSKGRRDISKRRFCSIHTICTNNCVPIFVITAVLIMVSCYNWGHSWLWEPSLTKNVASRSSHSYSRYTPDKLIQLQLSVYRINTYIWNVVDWAAKTSIDKAATSWLHFCILEGSSRDTVTAGCIVN